MLSERDDDLPLAALRDAWRGLTPPPLADAVEEADPATRATVDWMRAAFASLEVPAAPLSRLPRGLRKRGRWMPLPAPQLAAAAAAVLLAVGTWWWTHPGAPAVESGRPLVAEVMEPGPGEAGELDSPVVAALGPDRIELRSGPVRLILMQPTDGGNY